MSNDTARKTKRVVRRSIPILIPRETGKKTSNNSSSLTEKQPQAAAGTNRDSGVGDGRTTKTKLFTSERTIPSYREKTDEQPKARPPLSLQGPFNPNIVGHRKTDEVKRKRHPTPAQKNSETEKQGTTAPAPKTELFSNIRIEHEDHKPKRNPTQDKKRCSIEFQHKADTNFGESTEKSVLFTAAGKCASKPHAKHVSSRYMDPRKSGRLLQEKLQNLESQKSQLTEEYNKSISDLQKKLQTEQEEKAKLSAERSSLQEALKEKDTITSATVEEKTKSLSLQNEVLQERLETCQKKFEELNMDPVSLDEMTPLSESDLALRRKEASDEAAEFREELAEMNKRNREIIASLRLEDTKENNPLPELLEVLDISEKNKP